MEFKKSNRSGKKYMVLAPNGNWVHFGDLNMQHYKDSTPLKLYSHLDHNDLQRRKSYLARAKGIKNKLGQLTYTDKNSANYYAVNYLW